MAQNKNETGTFKIDKDTGAQERVAPIPPIPGIEKAENDMKDGAFLHQLEDMDQKKILLKAHKEEESMLLAAFKAEMADAPPIIEKDYGVIGDMKGVFRILHEQVGPFNRTEHKTLTWKDLAVFKTDPDPRIRDGARVNYRKVDVVATKHAVDRLLHLGAIEHLIYRG